MDRTKLVGIGLILACLFVAFPVTAGIITRNNPPDTGMVNETGAIYDTHYITSLGGASTPINNIIFHDGSYYTAATLQQFNYLGDFACFDVVNKTTNSSYTTASLYNGGSTWAGTGTIGYILNDNNVVYIYLSIDTWNSSFKPTGNQVLNLSYDKSAFDIKGRFPSTSNNTLPQSVGFAINSPLEMIGCQKVGAILYGATQGISRSTDWYIGYNRGMTAITVNKTVLGKTREANVRIWALETGTLIWHDMYNETSTDDVYFPLANTISSKLTIVNPVTGNGEELAWINPLGCNLTATVQNTINGNAVAQSTFKIYDLTRGTNEEFYLPFGIGSISIPYTGDYYKYNATRAGYVGYPAYPEDGVQITNCNSTLYTQVTGTPTPAGNSTISFFVHDPGDLAVGGATVTLGGWLKGTSLAGTASFPLLIMNETYDYVVSKTGWSTIEGNVTADLANVFVDITLTSGVQPTATTTVPTTLPLAGRDTSGDALKLVLENAYALAALFLVATIIGTFKIIAK